MDRSLLKFIDIVKKEFENSADINISISQKAYMKNNFEFYGIKTPNRRAIQKRLFSKDLLPKKADAKEKHYG